MNPSATLQIDQTTVLTSVKGLPVAEYALFDASEISLKVGDLGAIREQGYRTTAGRALDRLESSGLTRGLLDATGEALHPLVPRFVRGAASAKVAPLLTLTELLVGHLYDAGSQQYEGFFLDFWAISNALEQPNAGLWLQALGLYARIRAVPKTTDIFLSTVAYMLERRPGERSHRMPSLKGVETLPDRLMGLQSKAFTPMSSAPADRASSEVMVLLAPMNVPLARRENIELALLGETLPEVVDHTPTEKMDPKEIGASVSGTEEEKKSRPSVNDSDWEVAAPKRSISMAPVVLLKGRSSTTPPPKEIVVKGRSSNPPARNTPPPTEAALPTSTSRLSTPSPTLSASTVRLSQPPLPADWTQDLPPETVRTPSIVGGEVSRTPPLGMPPTTATAKLSKPEWGAASYIDLSESMRPPANDPDKLAPRGPRVVPPRQQLTPVESAERLALPPGLHGQVPIESHDLPQTEMEARVLFTHLTRELGRIYRVQYKVELKTDIASIERIQARMGDRIPKGRIRTDEQWLDFRRHGAFLSEYLARRLGAEWTDIGASELGYWEMTVPLTTRVWPFGRILRQLCSPSDRDLVSMVQELELRVKKASLEFAKP